MKRKITKAKVTRIALVPRGANLLPVLYKEDGGVPSLEFSTLTKATGDFEERGEILNVVYAPGMVDAQGDFADADAIRDMAHGFAKEMGGVELRHGADVLSRDRACVVESFIVQKGDARFESWTDYEARPVDVTGGWATVIKVDDPKLRKLYKDGGWNGVSLFAPEFKFELVKDQHGHAKTEGGKSFPAAAYAFVPDPTKPSTWKLRLYDSAEDVPEHPSVRLTADAVAALGPGFRGNKVELPADEVRAVRAKVRAAWTRARRNAGNGDAGEHHMPEHMSDWAKELEDMTDEEIKALVKTAVEAALAKSAPEKPKEPERPKVDPTNTASVKAHLVSLRKAQLEKDVDWADPEAVALHLQRLQKAEADAKLNETTEQKATRLEKELAEKELQLQKLGKASTQPAAGDVPGEQANLAKEVQGQLDAGKRIAAAANRMRGYKAA